MAAPVFRRDGYRGATIKALAHACGLSPASLYHYFSSKEDMATYLVRRPRMDWDSIWVDPTTDPLVQLAQLLDLSLAELPIYLLALRLADEVAGHPVGCRRARPHVPRGRGPVCPAHRRVGAGDVALRRDPDRS